MTSQTNKTILVTGAAGFIGSHLVDWLLAQDEIYGLAKVINVDNFNDYYDPRIKRDNIREHLKDPRYELQEGDLCDLPFLEKIFADNEITHIVHLAAMAGVRPSVEDPVGYEHNNGISTINLLKLASERVYKKKNPKTEATTGSGQIAKFVFASSSSVYGSRDNAPFNESEDISKPISPYAATKVSGEAICHTMSYLYDLPMVCLRFFTVYGPRQRPDLAIHKFTRLIDEGKEIPVYGDGSAKRDFTYIDDIIDGVVKAIDHECQYEIFNLGESDTIDVNTLIKLIEERVGKQAIINYMDPIPGDVPLTCADVSKSKSVLGYNPQTKVEAGLDKFVEWYRASLVKS